MDYIDFTYDLLDKGFKKVDQNGYSFILAKFYNQELNVASVVCVRDYDYADCSRDKDDLYNMPIDKEAYRAYLHAIGEVLEGDTVEVVKGRKVPIGTTGVIKKIFPYTDKYKRVVAYYAYLDNGEKTNVDNLKLIKSV